MRSDYSGVSVTERGSVACRSVWLYNSRGGVVELTAVSESGLTVAHSTFCSTQVTQLNGLQAVDTWNWIPHSPGIWTPFDSDLFSFTVLVGVFFLFLFFLTRQLFTWSTQNTSKWHDVTLRAEIHQDLRCLKCHEGWKDYYYSYRLVLFFICFFFGFLAHTHTHTHRFDSTILVEPSSDNSEFSEIKVCCT